MFNSLMEDSQFYDIMCEDAIEEDWYPEYIKVKQDRDHFMIYDNGRFIASADNRRECDEEIREYLKKKIK